MKKSILILTVLATSALMLSGCFRKHIESAPPVKQPARQVEAKPAPAPQKAEEQPEIIEETYIVDAPAEAAVQPADVGENDLAEEPLPQAEAVKEEAGIAETPAAEKTEGGVTAEKEVITEEVTVTEKVTVTEEVVAPVSTESGMYYVQIGAFSDLENANKVLARLLSDGYKDSVLSKTDTGLFRVQAGSFPDEASAENALAKLKTDYPEGFVFKKSADK